MNATSIPILLHHTIICLQFWRIVIPSRTRLSDRRPLPQPRHEPSHFPHKGYLPLESLPYVILPLLHPVPFLLSGLRIVAHSSGLPYPLLNPLVVNSLWMLLKVTCARGSFRPPPSYIHLELCRLLQIYMQLQLWLLQQPPGLPCPLLHLLPAFLLCCPL